MDNRPERVGVLDVGSNSVRLLVADLRGERVFCVHTEKITSRLLAGLKGDRLDPASVARTGDAVEALAARARALGAGRVEGFGTSAMRDGANSGELIRRAATIGVPLRVLSGTEEAELAYAGAAPQGRCAVLDIGGGSTEMLIGEDGNVLRAHSARVGAVRLSEEAGERAGADALTRLAAEALAPGWARVRGRPFDRVIGVGGTVTALCAMTLGLREYDPDRVTGFLLEAATAKTWRDRLCAMTRAERANLPGLNPQRADIIPAGAAILTAFFELSGAACLYGSDRDNLIGYIKKTMPPA